MNRGNNYLVASLHRAVLADFSPVSPVMAAWKGSLMARWFAQAIPGSPTLLSRRPFFFIGTALFDREGVKTVPDFPVPDSKVRMPKTFAQAMQFIAYQAEQIECQETLIAKHKKAMDFLNSYLEEKSSAEIKKAAKILEVEPTTLSAFLEDHGHITKQDSSWMPSDMCVRKGFMEVRQDEVNGFPIKRIRFTPIGLAWLVNLFKKSRDSDG